VRQYCQSYVDPHVVFDQEMDFKWSASLFGRTRRRALEGTADNLISSSAELG